MRIFTINMSRLIVVLVGTSSPTRDSTITGGTGFPLDIIPTTTMSDSESAVITMEYLDVTLMLWDLGGQPRFREVISDYFKGARIAIAVYDATRSFSLQRLTDWLDRVKENAPDCHILFVGNKIDERENGMGVNLEDETLAELASRYDAQVMEVSAKTGDGVTEMFEAAAKIALAKHNELVGN
jgi:Ras-related protein Rab-1A